MWFKTFDYGLTLRAFQFLAWKRFCCLPLCCSPFVLSHHIVEYTQTGKIHSMWFEFESNSFESIRGWYLLIKSIRLHFVKITQTKDHFSLEYRASVYNCIGFLAFGINLSSKNTAYIHRLEWITNGFPFALVFSE